MRKPVIESIMGGVVLLVAAYFLVFAYTSSHQTQVEGYHLQANFLKVGGLRVGSDVRISGIKVGSVIGQRLDQQTYEAVLTLSIRPDIRLPSDTVASIATQGLMGDKYIRLEPGSLQERLEDGGKITNTRDYKSLEDTVGEFIFLATGNGEGQR
ncbi:Mammalian cell entry related [uncultured Alphaproteobacteria bacterium]|uniref:Mammalian cell entry related n=1 Tax=uncultured Alphaproteobacteria bacterium TaxID=91750 RepID=A0A212JHN8_9PROT|nr:Mammalian cell entry related [uncultured Alphaproteobacteria bacterium]